MGAEIVENQMELHDDPSQFQWSRTLVGTGMAATLVVPPLPSAPTSKEHGAMATALAAGADGSVHRTLERCLIRWARGLSSEVEFWRGLLAPPDSAAAAGSCKDDSETAHKWLETGEVRWAWDDLCGYLHQARHAQQNLPDAKLAPRRILNAGSGPLAAGPLRCSSEITPV